MMRYRNLHRRYVDVDPIALTIVWYFADVIKIPICVHLSDWWCVYVLRTHIDRDLESEIYKEKIWYAFVWSGPTFRMNWTVRTRVYVETVAIEEFFVSFADKRNNTNAEASEAQASKVWNWNLDWDWGYPFGTGTILKRDWFSHSIWLIRSHRSQSQGCDHDCDF